MAKRFDFDSFEADMKAVLEANYTELRAIGLSPLPPESGNTYQIPETKEITNTLGHVVLGGSLRDELHNAHHWPEAS